MLLTLVIFIVMLGWLIFVHELGHFIAARRAGVTVHEFAFGFKPRLVSWTKGKTTFAINALPLGGYVRMEGEDSETGQPGAFASQPPLTRAKILLAGVAMNLVLAWVLLTLVYAFGSVAILPTMANHPGVVRGVEVVVVGVRADSPAAAAGVTVDDSVLAVDQTAITEADQLTRVVAAAAGQPVVLKLRRAGHVQYLNIVPRLSPLPGQGALGIALGEVIRVRASWWRAPIIAVAEVGSEIKLAFTGFVKFVGRLIVRRQVSQDVSGIVGIGAATGTIRRLGLGPFLQFMAIISTNLAVVNLMPILPLDGGHLVFLGVEAGLKRPIHESARQWLATFGLAFIVVLVLIVTYHDLHRFGIFQRLSLGG